MSGTFFLASCQQRRPHRATRSSPQTLAAKAAQSDGPEVRGRLPRQPRGGAGALRCAGAWPDSPEERGRLPRQSLPNVPQTPAAQATQNDAAPGASPLCPCGSVARCFCASLSLCASVRRRLCAAVGCACHAHIQQTEQKQVLSIASIIVSWILVCSPRATLFVHLRSSLQAGPRQMMEEAFNRPGFQRTCRSLCRKTARMDISRPFNALQMFHLLLLKNSEIFFGENAAPVETQNPMKTCKEKMLISSFYSILLGGGAPSLIYIWPC